MIGTEVTGIFNAEIVGAPAELVVPEEELATKVTMG